MVDTCGLYGSKEFPLKTFKLSGVGGGSYLVKETSKISFFKVSFSGNTS